MEGEERGTESASDTEYQTDGSASDESDSDSADTGTETETETVIDTPRGKHIIDTPRGKAQRCFFTYDVVWRGGGANFILSKYISHTIFVLFH